MPKTSLSSNYDGTLLPAGRLIYSVSPRNVSSIFVNSTDKSQSFIIIFGTY